MLPSILPSLSDCNFRACPRVSGENYQPSKEGRRGSKREIYIVLLILKVILWDYEMRILVPSKVVKISQADGFS